VIDPDIPEAKFIVPDRPSSSEFCFKCRTKCSQRSRHKIGNYDENARKESGVVESWHYASQTHLVTHSCPLFRCECLFIREHNTHADPLTYNGSALCIPAKVTHADRHFD
jgi:hypothetical protein